jgi:flagellar protein FlaF
MGVGVSVSTAIIFIGVVISAASMIGTLDDAQSTWIDIRQAIEERDMMASQTDIAIDHIDRTNWTVELLNTGGSTIHIAEIDVLLNGTWSNGLISSMEISGHEGSKYMYPGETLIIRFNVGLDDTSVKIVTGNGISAYY